jgi:tetratricopeptide (TPR) repeat protein
MLRRTLILVACPFVVAGLCSAQESMEPRPQSERPASDIACTEALQGDNPYAALDACRAEFDNADIPAELRRSIASLEYEHGDPLRAAALWKAILGDEGWTAEAAHARAMALWRGGDLEQTEAAFTDSATAHPSPETASDLLAFLLAFSRWDDAEAVAMQAVEQFPDACNLFELLGMARAGDGRHTEAAAAFVSAVEGGCPAFRWTTTGPVPEALDDPAYASLLSVELLTAGLRETDDRECEQRLRLLTIRPDAAAAEAVTGEVLFRDKLEVRFAGLGFLSQLGTDILPSWERLLASDDFILRKHTLRRIREINDPAFIPLLETHLERETLPRTKQLTTLVLGQALLQTEDVDRGRELLLSIPDDALVHAVALVELANHAEAAGELQAALDYLEQALAAGDNLHVNPERLEKLRAAVAADAP